MHLPKESQLLRIYIGEADRHQGHPLHEAIVIKARECGMAGATVLRSALGYGAASRIHSAKILRLSDDLPLVIEIVESEEKLSSFLPILKTMMTSGLVTLEKVTVVHAAVEPTPTP